MSNPFKFVEIQFWNLLLPINRQPKTRKEATEPPRSAPDKIRLEFLEKSQQEPIEAAPIQQILSSPTSEETLSTQPTIKIKRSDTKVSLYAGATVPTKIVRQKIKKGEAFMLIISSFLGLFIGILIAFIVK